MTMKKRIARKYMKKSNPELKIDIYDFDLTLFRSPEAPEWWKKRAFGQWYAEYPSLGDPFVPRRPSGYWVEPVVREARKSIADLNTWAIMCTGRLDRVALNYRIAELLAQKNLDFDQVLLNGMGVKTPPYKRAVVAKLLWKYPQVSKITLYEDTQENIDVVEALCQKKGVEFEGKLIRVDPHPLPNISKEEYMTFLENHLAQDELSLIKKKL